MFKVNLKTNIPWHVFASFKAFVLQPQKPLLGLVQNVWSGWKKNVAMGADGAAINLGHKGGVISLLQAEVASFVIPFHCMPHR